MRLSYSEAPEEFVRQISVSSFINRVEYMELQQELRFGRHEEFKKATIYDLKF